MSAPDAIHCDACGLSWFATPDDYPWLRPSEFVVCACGNPLIRKENLSGEEQSPLAATLASPPSTNTR